MRKSLGVLIAVLSLSIVSGCGKDDGPSLVNVNGTVTLDGAPLEGADVLFTPDSSNKDGLVGNDVTGPTGNYKAMTLGRSGLAPGKYNVTITKSSAKKPNPADPEADPYMDQLAAKTAGGGPQGSAAPAVIEEKFERDIPTAGGVQDFELKTKK